MTSRPVFHVHVMKTGGTTLGAIAHDLFTERQLYPTPSATAGRWAGFSAKSSPEELLALDPGERATLRFVSVHMPFWVCRDFSDDWLRVTLLRDPLERTISHLNQLADGLEWTDDVATLYGIPLVRDLLTNYQTRLFAARPSDHVRVIGLLDLALLRHHGHLESTEFTRSARMEEPHLDEAKANLVSMDVVGVLDRFDEFLAVVGSASGWPAVSTTRRRVGTPRPISPRLREVIHSDTALDHRLVDFARRELSTMN